MSSSGNPHNGSVPPSLFFENHPKILQNNLPTTSSGIFEETVSPDIHSTSSSTPEKIEETLSTARSPVQPSVNTPTTSALELPPKRKPKNATTGQPGTNFLQLHETLRRAKLASKLNRQPSAHNLTLPQTRNGTHELPSPSTDKIVYAKDEISLTKESSRLSYLRKTKRRVKRQISPDVATELNLNDAQLNSLQAQVNRRFLVGYDCANPQEVKPISSFIRDPCEPIADDQQDNYEIDDAAQYQIVQYETRREFKGTRSCERFPPRSRNLLITVETAFKSNQKLILTRIAKYPGGARPLAVVRLPQPVVLQHHLKDDLGRQVLVLEQAKTTKSHLKAPKART